MPTRKVSSDCTSNDFQIGKALSQPVFDATFPRDEKEEGLCNGVPSLHCYGTRYGGKIPPSLKFSLCDDIPEERIRPQRLRISTSHYGIKAEPECTHHLRSRGSVPNSSSEDESLPPAPPKGLSKISTENSVSKFEQLSRDDIVKESQGPKRKRLTAEEKLIEDNKAYYKLEMKNNKLRSSGHYPYHKGDSLLLKDEEKSLASNFKEIPQIFVDSSMKSENEHIEISSPVVANSTKTKREEPVPKFQRIRMSELNLLNNEAENFMFGETSKSKSPEISSDDEFSHVDAVNTQVQDMISNRSEVDNKTDIKSYLKMSLYSPARTNEETNELLINCDENSLCSIDSCSVGSSCDANSPNRVKRKRRTQAEAFIHDNLDYYKFEIHGSRLRFQGGVSQKPTSSTIGNMDCSTDSCWNRKSNSLKHESFTKNKIDKTSISEIVNPKDCVSSSEASSLRVNTCSDPHAESLLGRSLEQFKFSFETVPKNEAWYETFSRQDEGKEMYITGLGDSDYWKPFLLPYEMDPAIFLNTSAEASIKGSNGQCLTSVKKKRRSAALLDKKPRKSPRCHASTLAILSSLIHQRKRKDTDSLKDDDCTQVITEDEEEDAHRNDFESCSASRNPFQATESSEAPSDMRTLAQRVNDMLTYPIIEDIKSTLIEKGFLKNDLQEKYNDIKTNKNRSPKAIRAEHSKYKIKDEYSVLSTVKSDLSHGRDNDLSDVNHFPWKDDLNSTALDPPVLNIYNTPRCRGGPSMDIVDLLGSFLECPCIQDVSYFPKESGIFLSEISSILGASCNSSDCGASSTCETILDLSETRSAAPGRKRRRKINLTGWPVDKQKAKKKAIKKSEKLDDSGSATNNLHEKCTVGRSKCDISQSKLIVTGSKENEGVRYVKSNISEEIFGPNSPKHAEEENMLSKCNVHKNDLTVGNVKPSSIHTVVSTENSRDCVPSTEKKSISISRTVSLDSDLRYTDFQPCVRVKKIVNLPNEINSVNCGKGKVNSRRLRSFSSSSVTSHHFHSKHSSLDIQSDDSSEGVNFNKKLSSRQKVSRYNDWDSWSSKRRR